MGQDLKVYRAAGKWKHWERMCRQFYRARGRRESSAQEWIDGNTITRNERGWKNRSDIEVETRVTKVLRVSLMLRKNYTLRGKTEQGETGGKKRSDQRGRGEERRGKKGRWR